MPEFPHFSDTLIAWYNVNKRDLPWRKTKNPYAIWVSEIILQQTRVDQGLNYYYRFLEKFPDVNTLAGANEQEILSLWQGLGYYSRARNMHCAAKTIVEEHNGLFPDSYAEIKELKGVGDYTAAAIASFAFDLPHVVVDGNVMRVISRLFGIDSPIYSSIGKRRINEALELHFDKKRAAIFNQAIMEFGALQCIPAKPDCSSCPFSNQCTAYNTGKVSELPIRKKSITKKDRFFNYAVLRSGDSVVLKKRMNKDVWQNMYDFPLLEKENKEGNYRLNDFVNSVAEENSTIEAFYKSEWKTHLLSHQKIHARFFEFEVDAENLSIEKGWEITDLKNVNNYPLPKLIEVYINGL